MVSIKIIILHFITFLLTFLNNIMISLEINNIKLRIISLNI